MQKAKKYQTFLYTKRKKLCKKQDTLQKIRQFALRYIYTQQDTLRYSIFRGVFEIGGGGRYFYMQKTLHFALHFYMQKNAL